MTCKQSVDMPSYEHSVCYCIKCIAYKIRKAKEPKSLAPKQYLKIVHKNYDLLLCFQST